MENTTTIIWRFGIKFRIHTNKKQVTAYVIGTKGKSIPALERYVTERDANKDDNRPIFGVNGNPIMGTAKCHPEDKENQHIGIPLAIYRAINSLKTEEERAAKLFQKRLTSQTKDLLQVVTKQLPKSYLEKPQDDE